MAEHENCPMLHGTFAEKIDATLTSLLAAQTSAALEFRGLRTSVEVWLGNGKEGIVQKSLKALDDAVAEAIRLRADCAKECNAKIDAVRVIALDPPELDSIKREVHEHEEFIIAERSARRKASGIASAFREWAIPVLALVAITISLISLSRNPQQLAARPSQTQNVMVKP